MRLPSPLQAFNRQRYERLNTAHELAIAVGLGAQLAKHDYTRWRIDRYELLKEEVDGDRLYTVHYTGWHEGGETWAGAYDVWSGEHDGVLKAMSWMPL